MQQLHGEGPGWVSSSNGTLIIEFSVHVDARKPEYGFSYLMLMVDMLLTFHAKCSPQIVLVRYLS
jgi:hypothetical protein